jgi:hypothetical protein
LNQALINGPLLRVVAYHCSTLARWHLHAVYSLLACHKRLRWQFAHDSRVGRLEASEGRVSASPSSNANMVPLLPPNTAPTMPGFKVAYGKLGKQLRQACGATDDIVGMFRPL